MGLRTVALVTADELAEPFAVGADRAVLLDGQGAAAYLDPAAVVAAALAADADAVHPGYGFLSERAEAARAVVDAGLTWVGPHPEAIAAMGDKLAAKAAASAAGVPLLAGCELTGDEPAAWMAAVAAADLGWPLLVKAAAGGGGRGMRLVDGPDRLTEAVTAARREAEAAFGDGTVFAERWVGRARHIEVQVLGDRHGNVVHLGERECSIQRRHQKVIEEAPSPLVDGDLRAAMGHAAVELARAIGYDSLGTVEYVVDARSGEWSFLEMNARLQVEHPVTEAVTGLDLVRLQLEVAAGAPLPLGQDDVGLDGHAIEARVVAEDPARGWQPSTGTVVRWRPTDDGTRWDAAVADGSVVSPHFDSLVAKAITHAPTRDEAARRLAGSLRALRCHGVATSAGLLAALVDDEPFLSGDLHTGLLDEALPPAPRRSADAHLHLAAVLVGIVHDAGAADDRWARVPRGWRTAGRASIAVGLDADGTEVHAVLRPGTMTGRPTPGTASDETAVVAPGATAVDRTPSPSVVVEARWGDEGIVAAELEVLAVDGDAGDLDVVVAATDGGPRTVHRLHVHQVGTRVWVNDELGQTAWRLLPRFPDATAAAAGGGPTAPVPGKVVGVEVAAGDAVTAGQVLVVLEAMKVEHRIVAAADGVIDAVLVDVGDSVDAHQLLVRLADAGPDGPGPPA